MHGIIRTLLYMILVLSFFDVPSAAGEPLQTLTIAAANSLKEALRATAPLFEREQGSVNVRIVWGPSQTLREQVEQGAPIDLFLPSSLEEVEQLEQKGLIISGTKRAYAKTALVLITQAAVPARIASVQQLPSSDVRRIAVGNPKTSSVGKFALQVLRNYRLDEALKSRYVFAEHSAAVLHLVATGEADVGFVYRTDTIRHNNIRVLAELPDADHSPILYGLGTVWTAKSPSLARKFGDFLLSQPIQGLLKGYGFEPVSSELATLPQ